MTTQLPEVIVNNTYTDSASSFFPYHDVMDRAKAGSLTISMELNGWAGAPLVQHGGQLMTGSHRYAAARKAGIDLQIVDLCDVFCLDSDEINELISGCDNWVVEATYLAINDNAELANLLGMDAH